MENNFESLYFNILQYLSKSEIGVEKDISFLLKDRYIKANKTDIKIWNDAIGEASNFLNVMKNNGHIDYNYLSDKSDMTSLMVKDGTFFASITPDGFVFLQNYNVSQSAIINQNSQTNLLKATVGFAIVAIIVSLVNTCVEVKKYHKENQEKQLKATPILKSSNLNKCAKKMGLQGTSPTKVSSK